MGFILAIWGGFRDPRPKKQEKGDFHVQFSRIKNHASIRGRAYCFQDHSFMSKVAHSTAFDERNRYHYHTWGFLS